jgi:hypothetical protein
MDGWIWIWMDGWMDGWMDMDGWIWIGLDWIGLDWIGLDWIGLDWIGLDKTGGEENQIRTPVPAAVTSSSQALPGYTYKGTMILIGSWLVGTTIVFLYIEKSNIEGIIWPTVTQSIWRKGNLNVIMIYNSQNYTTIRY